jgi:hypothetical protein
MGFPLIKALAVLTPWDGFPSAPTIAFLDLGIPALISNPLAALALTLTGGIRDIGMSLHSY